VRRFGDFELDEARRELRLRGREVVLQPRVLDCSSSSPTAGNACDKEELLEALWPDVVVADGACIAR